MSKNNHNNQVIIERDMYCPYCEQNSAVLISETYMDKSLKSLAPVGLKNGCLLTVTCGCWAIISGFPLTEVKEEHFSNLYGFCPCCGNTYPVNKPEIEEKTVLDKFNDSKESFSRLAGQAKDMINKNDDE